MPGVEPDPPRCKRGALPVELHPRVMRTSGVEPPQPEALALQARELAGAQRPHGVAGRIRTGAAGITTPNARRYTTATAGTAGLEPAASRLTSERSGRLSYAPVKSRGWDSNPRSRAHEAREDNRSSTALGLAGRTRTCDPRLPGPVGWPAPPQPDGDQEGMEGSGGRNRTCALAGNNRVSFHSTTPERSGGRRGSRTRKARRPTRFRDVIPRRWQSFRKWPRQASNPHLPG